MILFQIFIFWISSWSTSHFRIWGSNKILYFKCITLVIYGFLFVMQMKYNILVIPESVWAQGSSNSGGSVKHLLIFTSSHLHIFSLSLIFSSSHLLIFTSSHLHTFSSSHLLIFTSSHLHIFSSSHLLLIFSSSHLLISSSSHIHIFSSSHLLIFTSSHLHIFSSSHLHIFSHLLTSSHIFSHLLLLPSCPLALLPSCLLYLSLLRPRVVRAASHETSTISHEMRVDRQKLR